MIRGMIAAANSRPKSNGGGADPYWANVVLLLHLDGPTGFSDSSPTGAVPTAIGSSAISTSIKQFGAGSLFVGANGATSGGITVTGGSVTSSLALGAGDFTVELAVRPAQPLTSLFWSTLIDFQKPSSSNRLMLQADSTRVRVLVDGTVKLTVNPTVPSTVWTHVAISRIGGTSRLFIAGVLAGSWADTINYSTSFDRPIIGAQGYSAGTNPLDGHIDEVRVTKGVGRYLTTFTPPSAPYPSS